jgi:hypothetical protein
VIEVTQEHSLGVGLRLKDGTTCWSTETRIDEVIELINEAGLKDKIGYTTE